MSTQKPTNTIHTVDTKKSYSLNNN